MTLDFICGHERIEARAGRGSGGQYLADVIAQGAARPRTLIART